MTGASCSSRLDFTTRGIRQFLDDPRVLEIMLNPDGQLWIDRAGEGQSRADVHVDPRDAEALLRLVATESGTTLTTEKTTLAGTLPKWGARVQGWIPPTVLAPTFSIRKPALLVFSLKDYVEKKVITEEQRAALTRAILDRKNILVGGGTFTGKTTFANALLRVIAEQTNDRLYIAEDNRELQCLAPNKVSVYTERGKYEMRDAIFDALRARPDRIIVGELRDSSALELLKAWYTGHPGGLATIHANDCPSMLTRFCQLIEEDRKRADRELVAEAIHVCVHLQLDRHSPAGRRVSGIQAVKGYDRAQRRWLLEPLAG